MGKRTTAATAAPTAIAFGTTPVEILANLRVVDAGSGEPIVRVISADSEAGKVSRYAVEDGNLVREGNAFKTVDEDRKIRIEWIDPPVPATGDDVGEQEG